MTSWIEYCSKNFHYFQHHKIGFSLILDSLFPLKQGDIQYKRFSNDQEFYQRKVPLKVAWYPIAGNSKQGDGPQKHQHEKGIQGKLHAEYREYPFVSHRQDCGDYPVPNRTDKEQSFVVFFGSYFSHPFWVLYSNPFYLGARRGCAETSL